MPHDELREDARTDARERALVDLTETNGLVPRCAESLFDPADARKQPKGPQCRSLMRSFALETNARSPLRTLSREFELKMFATRHPIQPSRDRAPHAG